jgi:exopolysaccharide production protein ExoQ
MSYVYYPDARPMTRAHRFPWPVFLFLSLAFFLTFHWPPEAQRTLDDYNTSQEQIVAGVAAGSAVRQIVFIVLGVVAIISLVSRPADRRLRIDGLMGWLLVGFAAWALMSSMWSEDLPLTLKRLASFGILCVVAVAVVRRFSLREVLMWTFFTTALFLMIAVAVEVLSGAFQPFASGYRFSGTQHPNGEGVECGLLLLSGLAAAKGEKHRRWLFGAFALLGFVFLILTASRTAFAATLLGLAVYVAAVSSRKTKTLTVPAFGILACLLLLFVGTGSSRELESALSLGRDDAGNVASYGGRTTIWEDVTPYIREHPIVGYGYGAFWTPTHISVISEEEKWGVPDSHSAYVDYLLMLGAVGLILYLLCLFAGLWRVLGFYRLTRDPHLAFLAGLLIFCIVNGFSESAIAEGSLLTFLSLIVLMRLAFVPLEETRRIAAESRSRHEEVCPA